MPEWLAAVLLLALVGAYGLLSYARGFRRGLKVGAVIATQKINAELALHPVRHKGQVKQFGVEIRLP